MHVHQIYSIARAVGIFRSRDVLFVFSNNHFQFLNNILHISLHFFLNHTFLKYVIVSYLDPLVFSPNNSFATKIKKINRHVVEN